MTSYLSTVVFSTLMRIRILRTTA